jgi:glycosyltransferase involved in cell wall biosynthesis
MRRLKIGLACPSWGRNGGAQDITRWLALELARRGHVVTVGVDDIADTSPSPVSVTQNLGYFAVQDAVIVVGHFNYGNFDVIEAARRGHIRCPMLIWPLEPAVRLLRWAADHSQGIQRDRLTVLCSTSYDLACAAAAGLSDRIARVRYGVPAQLGRPGFKARRGIRTRRMIASCGGFDAHKGFEELKAAFMEARLTDTTLILTGFRTMKQMPKEDGDVRVYKLDNRQEALDAIYESDLYVMNSTREGFGLVLLEAMQNKTPWASRDIAGGHDMRAFGMTYTDKEGLIRCLRDAATGLTAARIMEAYQYYSANHTDAVMADDFENALQDATGL